MAVVVLLIGYVFGSVALSQEARVDSENIVSDWMSITNDQPGWSNSVGWNDPAKYSTIQAVAVGNELYLIGKADDGMYTLRLDRNAGRWDTIVANQPGWSESFGWGRPEYYSTIQAVAVGSELYMIGKATAGIYTLRLDRASDQWITVAAEQPGWSNSVGWNDPANYSTIQAVAVGNELYLIGKADDGIQTYSSDFVRLERERKFFPAMQPGAHRDAADI